MKDYRLINNFLSVIAFIEDYKIVKKILDYLGIYEFEKKRPPPKISTFPNGFDDDVYLDSREVRPPFPKA